MLRYVIFDMDGVLIDSEPIHALAAKNAIARYGVTVGGSNGQFYTMF